MLRRLFVKNRLSIVALIALIAMTGTILMLSCTKDNPVQPPEPTWNLTLDVLNGHSGDKISGATVQYMNGQTDTVVTSNAEGRVKIEGLSEGTQSFTITYVDQLSKYTSVVIQATSLNTPDTGKVGKLADQAQTVKLFPLAGSISGKLVSQVNTIAAKVPVANAVVTVTYENSDLDNASNKAVSVITDATGAFAFTGLPVAPGLKVTVSPVTIGEIDFAPAEFEQPVLASGVTVPMGTLIATPIDAKNFKLLSNLPTVIAPNDSIVLTYSDPVDTNSYAVIEGVNGSQSVRVSTVVSGKNLIIKPEISLVDGNQYKLVVHTYGWAGGYVNSVTNFSVKGGGVIDVINSNVLDANHQAKDGLGLTDTMAFAFRAPITSASATVKYGGKVVLVNTAVYSNVLYIIPKGNWVSGTYNVKISANLSDGKASTFTIDVATVGAFAFVSSNVYNPQNGQGINGLGWRDTIVVTANKPLASVQATLQEEGSSSAQVPVTCTITDQTVNIIPANALRQEASYRIKVTAATAEGETESFDVYFATASSDFYPVSDNIRFDNDPYKPVLNFPPNGTIVIKMSAPVQSATAQLNRGNNAVPINVTFSTDTILITPVQNLIESTDHTLRISAKSTTGTVYNQYYVYYFRVQPNRAYVVASNVMNTNGLGLTNVPITVTPYFVLSQTPDPATVVVTLTPAVDATVSFSGDTIWVKPVKNLVSKTSYATTIKGKTTQNTTIDLDLSGTAAFTTSQAVFVVATNLQDAQGNQANNLLPSSELWVKFSRPLSTDLTKHVLGGGTGTTVAYTYGATNNNATIRVSGDTLFAKFLPNLLPVYGATISLRTTTVLFDDATTINTVNLTAKIVDKQKPYVAATNGYKDNALVDTFNVLDEVWIKSSLAFLKVDGIKNVAGGSNVGANNLVLSNVRTSGDTIFFKPAIKLAYDDSFAVAFEVTLTDSTKYTGSDLKLVWKTRKGLFLVSANDMVASKDAYRPFSVTGDTLIINFSKAIDVTKAFDVTGFAGNKVNYLWDAAKKQVKVVPVEPLAVKAYDPNPDYSLAGTPEYSNIAITATTTDDETWTSKIANKAAFDDKRPALAVHTVPGIEVLNTNLKVSSVNINQPYVNTTNTKLSTLITDGKVVQNDSVNYGDTIKVYFSRAVDGAAVASKTPHPVRLLSGGITQNITISYDPSGKTMYIKPVVQLTAGTNYALVLDNVQASGLPSTDANAKVSYTLNFKTKVLPTKPVTSAVVALLADTALATDVYGKRLGYSGSKSSAYQNGAISGSVPSINTIRLYWKDVAFRSTTDTVTHYQYSVKGANGSWYYLKSLTPAYHYDPFNPLADSIYKRTLDLNGSVEDVNGINVGPALRVPTMDGNHQNDPNIFNYGATVQVQIRPVVSTNDAQWDDDDKAGTWSNIVTFQDNIAPCDSDFVGAGNLTNRLAGGVSISAISIPGLDRTGNPDAGQYVFQFIFPEDMDKSTKPAISFWYGDTVGFGAFVPRFVVDNVNSYWTNDYTYQLTVTIPGNFDWASRVPYYALSVAGMKDASGVTIGTWGSVGNPENAKLIGAVTGESVGSVNLRGLDSF